VQSLPTIFTYDGHNFRQLKRDGMVALYEKAPVEGGMEVYEVVIIRRHPAQKMFGKEYPEREAMPTSESWGKEGWTLATLERAREKFLEVCE
jgi:ABC-type cobalamin/Fe3+-siderophores transport system ATPase subunit